MIFLKWGGREGRQRPFGTFLKIHPIWKRAPSLIRAMPERKHFFPMTPSLRSIHSIFNKVVSVWVTCIDYDWTSDKNADWSGMASLFLDVFLVLIFLLGLIFMPFACPIHNNSNLNRQDAQQQLNQNLHKHTASLLVLDNILKLRQNLFHMFLFWAGGLERDIPQQLCFCLFPFLYN